jgi:hypothetical protein
MRSARTSTILYANYDAIHFRRLNEIARTGTCYLIRQPLTTLQESCRFGKYPRSQDYTRQYLILGRLDNAEDRVNPSDHGRNQHRNSLVPLQYDALRHQPTEHIYREHQICFFESHFTEMKAGWIAGEAGTSDTQMRWDINSVSHWNTTWEAGIWHSVAYEIVCSTLKLWQHQIHVNCYLRISAGVQ